MPEKITRIFRRLYRMAITHRAKALAILLGVVIIWFAISAVCTSFLDVKALKLYELSTLSANEIHLSIDSFDPDTGKIQVTARPAYGDLFIVADMQEVIPEFLNTKLAAKAPPNVRFGKLFVFDLGPYLQAAGLQLAQVGMSPAPEDCKSKKMDANDQPQTDTWRVLERPMDRNFFSIWKGPEMYPFDEYLVVGRAERTIEFCYKGKPYTKDSTLDVSVSLPGYSVTSATPAELLAWPTLQNPEPDINGAPRKDRTQGPRARGAFHLPKYNQRMWQDQQVALMIRRPLALRKMAILLLGITAIATIFLALTSARTEIARNFAGSLLTIWAARGLLTLNAPKTPNLLDFFAMFLFAVIASLYLSRYIWLWSSERSDEASCTSEE
jgi:hypothetical protein